MYLVDGPAPGPDIWTVILAHGAGAPMDTPFMQAMAEGLAAGGLRVIRFEFPYMAQRRVDGKKRPPNPMPKLIERFQEAVDHAEAGDRLILAGKSMGARVASHLTQAGRAAGAMCLGYPFHPPGKPEKTRLEPLQGDRPVLIAQGTRDPFGKPDEVAAYGLPDHVQVAWIEDGDHSLKPRKASGRTEPQNWQAAVEAMLGFVGALRG